MVEAGQLTLFAKKDDFEKAFQEGDIVAQTWDWIGSFNSIFPFWQVQHSEIHNGRRCYFCHAVPYGTHPCEVHWFEKEDLIPTGLRWDKIPTDKELDEWCRNFHKDGQSLYVKQLNSSRRDEGDWYHYFYPPYPEEQELVDLLKKLPIDYLTITRDNFDEKMKPLMEMKHGKNKVD